VGVLVDQAHVEMLGHGSVGVRAGQAVVMLVPRLGPHDCRPPQAIPA
jgi:hypothetical protein